jgi:hypothetical protein
MDALIVFAMLLVIGAPIGYVAAYAIVKGPDVIALVLGLDAEPPWPRGVQEDDAPPRWKLDGRGD